ncbi:NAD(P)-binding protein [Mycena crocata]|nr:NAD(P)-binding protein [Mycena crocata]
MPAISSGKVLVSGANGFVAAWVVRSLLEDGFSVRGAVRSDAKGTHLSIMFASYGEKFEVVVVPDITQDGAFDEAVKGVDAIEHTASPAHLRADEPEEMTTPAIQGTVGILKSAIKYGNSVKRVVVTSSIAAIIKMEPDPKTFDESDWNEWAPKEIAEKGRSASAIAKYRASKALAERAAWEFMNQHKSDISWDLVVLNPPYVLGPVIHEVSSPDKLNASMHHLYTMLTQPASPETLLTGSSWVDPRDLGRAHVLALRKEDAAGERIIVSAGPYTWQDYSVDAVPDSPKYQKGSPGAGKNIVHHVRYNANKSVRILGMTYHAFEETIQDTVADFEARGW